MRVWNNIHDVPVYQDVRDKDGYIWRPGRNHLGYWHVDWDTWEMWGPLDGDPNQFAPFEEIK